MPDEQVYTPGEVYTHTWPAILEEMARQKDILAAQLAKEQSWVGSPTRYHSEGSAFWDAGVRGPNAFPPVPKSASKSDSSNNAEAISATNADSNNLGGPI